MILNLTKKYIEDSLKQIENLDVILKNSLTKQGYIDYLQGIGKEHYKLFISISMQINNCKILEIGTHHGNSAVALGFSNIYTKNITLNTLDIIDIVQPNCKNFFINNNINFSILNLLDANTRTKYKDKILENDIIYIDIDPHEGLLEYEMYIWLKQNNYNGIIIFDDIKLGLGHSANNTPPIRHKMSDFWDKVDNNDKLDITNVGHASGTGLVYFNKEKNRIIV